ncbi:MAG TPA: ferredoxin-type protein NapG, partial [Oceanithermus profundus]|nr:ferredoxin-type protein NapG [Oceanithermus profundus]
MPEVDETRRRMIFRTLQGVTLTAVGGAFWAGFVHENAQEELVLRPPGARPEEEFLATCIRCGLCV